MIDDFKRSDRVVLRPPLLHLTLDIDIKTALESFETLHLSTVTPMTMHRPDQSAVRSSSELCNLRWLGILVKKSALAAGMLVGFAPLAWGQSNGGFDPYSVFVIQDHSHTRCGPGDDFYRTDPVRHGQQLEVFAETNDGWLGVRPPDGSFCWIPADAVETDPGDKTATVLEDKTVSWIGTQLGRATKYRWQVQLARGETVSILGRSEREGPDGPQTWYRIVPPSGEFRWIHRNQVVNSSEELVKYVQEAGDGSDREFMPDGPTYIEGEPARAERPARVVSTGRPKRAKASEPSKVAEESGLSVLENEIVDLVPVQRNTSHDELARTSEPQPSREPLIPRVINRSGTFSGDAHDSTKVADATSVPPKTGLLAYLTRPRITEMNAIAPAPPMPYEQIDPMEGWVTNTSPRQSTRSDSNGLQIDDRQLLAQVGYQEPLQTTRTNSPASLSSVPAMPAQTLTPISSLPDLRSIPSPSSFDNNLVQASSVPVETLNRLQSELASATPDQLNLILSRLMSHSASAQEIEAVYQAARNAVSTAQGMQRDVLDSVQRRALSMADVARRREAVSPTTRQTSIGFAASSHPLATLSAPTIVPMSSPQSGSTNILSAGDGSTGVAMASAASAAVPLPEILQSEPTVSGQLVQVYSARADSPPYALTDSAGRTLCYVTPIPGVNLQPHLNNSVTIRGPQSYLSGLSTPHIQAQSVIRR